MFRTIILIIVLVIFIFIIACSSSTDSNYDPPADHAVNKDGIKHKSGLSNPMENCVSCHGSDLRGSDTAPSCYECHGKKW